MSDRVGWMPDNPSRYKPSDCVVCRGQHGLDICCVDSPENPTIPVCRYCCGTVDRDELLAMYTIPEDLRVGDGL